MKRLAERHGRALYRRGHDYARQTARPYQRDQRCVYLDTMASGFCVLLDGASSANSSRPVRKSLSTPYMFLLKSKIASLVA